MVDKSLIQAVTVAVISTVIAHQLTKKLIKK